MLYFIIGTKAQFIKTAPVIHEAERRKIPLRIVDLGQHADITGRILSDFGLHAEIVRVLPSQRTVSDYAGAVKWLARLGRRLVFPGKLRQRVFPVRGVALVHGDTLSTLIGALLARRLGLRVGLIEAGLTSNNIWSPFPEESIRRSCERLAHILFAPGPVAFSRLDVAGRKARIVDTGYNTGRDALAMQLRAGVPRGRFALVTLHRLETLKNTQRLARAVRYIEQVADRMPVTLVLHPPTRKTLQAHGYLSRFEQHENVDIRDLLPYPDFLQLLAGAEVVLTDGGSVQEECSYVQKRCIVLRDFTERSHGLNSTAMMTSWSADEDFERLRTLSDKGSGFEHPELSASRQIIDTVLEQLDGVPASKMAE